MKTDSQIQSDVMQELKWDASVTHEHIGVTVKDGVVTLTGSVPSYMEKFAAKHVYGVKAVVEKTQVELPGSHQRDDQDLAEAVLSALRWNVQVPDRMLKVTVSDGWVTLSGEVDWKFQKQAAENSIRILTGVKGVMNEISIKSRVLPSDIKQQIEQALKRAVEREAQRIKVSVQGGKVILAGNVRSLADLRDVKGAVWNAPGVSSVEDRLSIAA